MGIRDYPIDVYYCIYSKLNHQEFPIDGCWQLSRNSRIAIERLGYEWCSQENSEYHEKDCARECEICQENSKHIGFTCCAEYTGYSMSLCDGCQQVMCGHCCNDCGYCSDPAGFKKYYCYLCSTNCSVCREVLCEYCNCGQENNYCEECNVSYHFYCEHECKIGN